MMRSSNLDHRSGSNCRFIERGRLSASLGRAIEQACGLQVMEKDEIGL
jgi:hypothetical protein